MRTRLIQVIAPALGAAALSGIVGAARAQETAQLIVDVSNSTLAPGESTEVRVSVAYAPRVGGTAIWTTQHGGTGQIGTVAGFALAVFNVNANRAAGVTGSWSNPAFGPWASVFSSPGTIVGNSVLNANIGTGFGPPLVPAVTENPLLLWTATWTAAPSSGFGNVNLIVDVLQGSPSHPNTVHLWLQVGMFNFSVEDAWDCTDGQAIITVIPAPSSAAAVGLGVLLAGAGHRRRVSAPARA